jgi:hypothetical protein
MSDRIKHRLGKELSKSSVNTDTGIGVNITQNNRLLPSGDMNRILDVSEQFNKERNSSTNYRFIISLNGLLTNVLTDINNNGINNTDTLWYLSGNTFMVDGDGNTLFNNSVDCIKNYRIDSNGWIGYTNPAWVTNNTCKFIDLYPKREVFNFAPKNKIKNWNMFLTYPSTTDKTHTLVNGGLLIINKNVGNIGSKEYISLTTPVKHGLNKGDVVNIDNNNYNVLRTGEDNGDNQDYVFIIELPSPSNIVGINSRMKRVYNGQESEYYFRVFEKLSGQDDYEVYPIAFSKNLFSDNLCQVVFNKDIDTSIYKDNLGRPISEVYLTIIKENNNGFSNIDSGIEIPFFNTVPLDIPDINRIHNSNITTISNDSIENNVLSNDNVFYGDVVEYNKLNVSEVLLGEVRHRFNRVNRDVMKHAEGYYYKPHHKIELRYWSTFVEEGDNNTIGIPDYAEKIDGNRYLWRDLLDIGMNDGQSKILDYPFLNGSHYPYSNVILKLRRQDPFNIYGLYKTIEPTDIFGNKINLDNNTIKKNVDGYCS